MARGVNKAIIVGNLGRDPEVRYTANGSAVANITVATSESWKDKQSGERQERTEWHRVVFFRAPGGNCRGISEKGFAGLHRRKHTRLKNGKTRRAVRIVIRPRLLHSDMQMLGSRGVEASGPHRATIIRVPRVLRRPVLAAAPAAVIRISTTIFPSNGLSRSWWVYSRIDFEGILRSYPLPAGDCGSDG